MTTSFTSAAAIPVGFWRWVNFTPAEWADHTTGELVVDPEYMDDLQALRDACGFPLPVNSGYRTPAHNAAVSTTGETGPHTTARATDIRIYGERAFQLVTHALALGFTGIGVAQKGDVNGRYIHVDKLPTDNPLIPRCAIWSY